MSLYAKLSNRFGTQPKNDTPRVRKIVSAAKTLRDYLNIDELESFLKGLQQRKQQSMGFSNEPLTPGGGAFREWLIQREDMNQQPGVVQNPNNPQNAARNQAVNKFTTQMMAKNNMLKPKSMRPQDITNAINSNPELSKSDPETQQAVTSFFLKQ